MEIRKLLGNRVYLSLPEEIKSNLLLDAESRKALKEENAKRLEKLTVYAVGDSVTDLTEGDDVMVDPSSMSAQRPVIIPLSDKKEVWLVSYFDIAHIW